MANADNKKKPSRLGRGLSSLMATPVAVDAPPAEASPPTASKAASADKPAKVEPAVSRGLSSEGAVVGGAGLQRLAVKKIGPNPHQPRQHFAESSLKSLADSIRSEGVMQPIVVRKAGRGAGIDYELVAGERRWRAAQIAGLTEIPALLYDLDDRQSAEWALIENLQREDLNPIERAEAFRRLAEEFGLNHDEVAERVGLERSTVSNLLRLLRLTPEVRDMVARDLLSMGQSRAIAGLDDGPAQLALAKRAVSEGLSVRQVESAVRELNAPAADPKSKPTAKVRSAYLDDLERQIGETLQTKVAIKTARKKGAGTLSIDFYSLDQFDELLVKLGVETN